MHLIWSSEVKCVVTVWFLWSFWYILSNGVGDVTSRWRHFWFTSQHQSDLKYITHNSGSHYCFYYHSHQHTRTRNKNIYIAIKDYPQIGVWSYLPQVVHSFWERPIYVIFSFCLLHPTPCLLCVWCARNIVFMYTFCWCCKSQCAHPGQWTLHYRNDCCYYDVIVQRISNVCFSVTLLFYVRFYVTLYCDFYW